MTTIIKVAIVENDTLLCKTLQMVLDGQPNMRCVGAFVSGERAVAELPALAPDVVLMDIDLGERLTGIDCVRALRPLCRETQFLILTIFEDGERVFDALSAGAMGYVLKSAGPTKIVEAIVDLHEGGSPMSPGIARKLVISLSQPAPPAPDEPTREATLLTAREREVIELIAIGKLEKEVADVLFISPKTVKKHIGNIYEKLQVRTRIEALNKYYGR